MKIVTVGDLIRALQELPPDGLLVGHNSSEQNPAWTTLTLTATDMVVKGTPGVWWIENDVELDEDDDGNVQP